MPLVLRLCTGLLLLLPLRSMAAQVTEIPPLPAAWDLRQVSVQQEQGGLLLFFAPNASIFATTPPGSVIDEVRLHVQVPTTTNAQFVWHPTHLPSDTMGVFPVRLAAGGTGVSIPAADIRSWDRRTDRIGLTLDEGGVAFLAGATLTRLSAWEKMTNAWRTFWKPDTFAAHTINFLWGPLLTVTPSGYHGLYDLFPPLARSGMRVLLTLLLAGAAVGGVWAWIRSRGVATGIWQGLFLAIALCWAVLEVRMSSEMAGYVHADLRSYVTAPVQQRSLRGTRDLFALLELAAPHVRGAAHIGVLAPRGVPLFSYAQYAFHPTVPVPAPPFPTDTDIWLVFHRPGVQTGSGRLVLEDGTVIAAGEVLERTPEGSVVFRSTRE